ncbi:MAG: 6-bladed beta-propeller [Candidatus Micrarchaeia archaeon]
MFVKKIYFLLEIFLFIILFSCERKGKIPEIINLKPRYQDNKYVELERIYRIDVTQINLFSKQNDYEGSYDFDVNNNLYILDRYEGTITVYDENGKLINKFGRKGEGPNEFLDAHFMVINKDKIYVYQGFFVLKIVDLKGEYISKKVCGYVYENPLRVRSVGDKFYILKGKTDHTFTKLKIILSSCDETLRGGKELFKYEYPLGLSGPPCWEWMLILDNGEFYYPEDNLNKYLITKYDSSGKPKLKFGREYQIKKFSEEARKEFYSTYKKEIEKGRMKFLESPPIVRRMFQDEKENIWVVSGEVYEDNRNPGYENSVDIFDKNGKWIFSFKSKIISKNCFYRRGKIYKVLPLSTESYEQFIEVYKIKYLTD